MYLQSSGAKLGAYNMNRLALIAAAGGEPKLLAEALDRGVASPRFSTDVTDYGVNDVSSRDKDVNAVVSATFDVKD